jgi:hypothetical protein
MDRIVIDDIAFAPDVEGLKKTLLIEAGSEDERDFDRMLAQARSIARPKVLFAQAFVEPAAPDRTMIDGLEFRSRVLALNLEGKHRVVVFALTGGREIETWAESYASDPLSSYWSDSICEAALRCASERFDLTMVNTMGFEKASTMSPGSLEDWPMSEQIPLFSLLGDTRKAIGLELTDSLLMLPRKSVSGILFPVQERFESCQLCPRENCPNRRMPYDRSLAELKFAEAT